jgi:asparagine N-glycosylation enzyme membrane subunit Stt3
MMRATHDLVTGNVAGALDHNVLIVVFAPLVVFLWVRWLLRSWRGSTPDVTYAQFRRRNTWMYASLAAVLVFGVVRNFVPYLGSGVG